MTDNGLAALVEWLDGDDGVWYDRFGLWLSGRRDTAWLAAKMIGERGVFLPDGTCGHEEEYLGYWRATNEALATIAALRAALDGLVAAAQMAVPALAYGAPVQAAAGLGDPEPAFRAALATAKEAGG